MIKIFINTYNTITYHMHIKVSLDVTQPHFRVTFGLHNDFLTARPAEGTTSR
jgi:hypothetical protein